MNAAMNGESVLLGNGKARKAALWMRSADFMTTIACAFAFWSVCPWAYSESDSGSTGIAGSSLSPISAEPVRSRIHPPKLASPAAAAAFGTSEKEVPSPAPMLHVAQANLERAVSELTLRTYLSSNPSRESDGPVMVHFGSWDDQTRGQVEEDLLVMSRLIERKLAPLTETSSAGRRRGLLISSSGARAVRSFYFDGFGAVFMLRVRMSLVAPDDAAESVSDRAADRSWEQAWRDVFGDTEEDDGPGLGDINGANFDTNDVIRLKSALLLALKHASNIRHLKSDEMISLTVFGTSPPRSKAEIGKAPSRRTAVDNSEPKSDGPASEKRPETKTERARDRSRADQATVFTVRVKKRDVDAFANNDLTPEQFRQKTVMHAYTANIFAGRPRSTR
jgi:hypothetical protein